MQGKHKSIRNLFYIYFMILPSADQWLQMARESYQRLVKHVNETIVPNILAHFGFTGTAADQIHETINWRFFDQIPKNVPNLLNALQRLLSETKYEKSFFETIEMLSAENNRLYDDIVTASAALVNILPPALRATDSISEEENDVIFKQDDGIMEHRTINDDDTIEQSPPPLPTNSKASLFVYSFQHSNTMDLRGKINYFGGAGHSSDLLFLMGPSLYQQIGRRRLSPSEEKLCKRMRTYWADFVRTGNPTPGRLFADAWQPYTRRRRHIQLLGVASSVLDPTNDNDIGSSVLDRNRVPIAEMISTDGGDASLSGSNRDDYNIGGGNRKFDVSRMPKSYLPEVNDSEYYRAMGRVSAFWNELLPRIQRKQTRWADLNGIRGGHGNETDLEYLSNDVGSKFKHAFFSMLVLVCLLLGILGVCVYILQKGPRAAEASSYL